MRAYWMLKKCLWFFFLNLGYMQVNFWQLLWTSRKLMMQQSCMSLLCPSFVRHCHWHRVAKTHDFFLNVSKMPFFKNILLSHSELLLDLLQTSWVTNHTVQSLYFTLYFPKALNFLWLNPIKFILLQKIVYRYIVI